MMGPCEPSLAVPGRPAAPGAGSGRRVQAAAAPAAAAGLAPGGHARGPQRPAACLPGPATPPAAARRPRRTPPPHPHALDSPHRCRSRVHPARPAHVSSACLVGQSRQTRACRPCRQTHTARQARLSCCRRPVSPARCYPLLALPAGQGRGRAAPRPRRRSRLAGPARAERRPRRAGARRSRTRRRACSRAGAPAGR